MPWYIIREVAMGRNSNAGKTHSQPEPDMPSAPDPTAIQKQIAALVDGLRNRMPRTRLIQMNLELIEEAMRRGVTRAELAITYEMTPNQFAAALAGARRLQRNGGDSRLNSVKKKRPRPPQQSVGSRENPLISDL